MSRVPQALFSVLVLVLVSSPAGALDKQAAQHWQDFIHYSRVARPDLAAANGRQLLQMNLEPADLLEVIAASPYADSFERDLSRMRNMTGDGVAETGIVEVATNVEKAIDEAKLALARDPERVNAEIEKLDKGLRAQRNATRRLKESGEYAAPQLLEIVIGQTDRAQRLRPFALEALVAIGRPVVIPLAEAIGVVDPVSQQHIARVLARIGYPAALPYLKRLAESPDTDEDTRAVLMETFRAIGEGRGIAETTAAADLFLMLARDYYDGKPSLILSPDEDVNLMWSVTDRGRLTYREVPTPIFDEVMSMQASKRSLQLDANRLEALSLWVAANIRRENELPAGRRDPSYGDEMQSPRFYATLAGPAHLKWVLTTALEDGDAELARDAIAALASVDGPESLRADPGPMLRALSYGDRRVRFEAAMAIARAKPRGGFTGAGRVIPVLAEAVRQGDTKVALAVAGEMDRANALAATVRAAGSFDVLVGTSLADLRDDLTTVAAADLIVIEADHATATGFEAERRGMYKIESAPMVIAALPGNTATLTQAFSRMPTVVVSSTDEAAISAAIGQAEATVGAGAIDAALAEKYATESLQLMRELAPLTIEDMDVSLASAALIAALDDPRPAVAAAAARVVSLIAADEAQAALAEAGTDQSRAPDLRVVFLEQLAASARRHGNRLDDRLTAALLEVIKTSAGELADAAAQAHGALDLPTAHGVELITR